MGGIVSRKKTQVEPEVANDEPPVAAADEEEVLITSPPNPEKPELAQWTPPPLKNSHLGMRVVTLEV
jgi:hypothetical protein